MEAEAEAGAGARAGSENILSFTRNKQDIIRLL